MKKILLVLFVTIIIALVVGFYFKSFINFKLGERIIGFSVLVGVFLYLPLFLYHRWKDKSLKDYTLSDKNLKKIQRKNRI